MTMEVEALPNESLMGVLDRLAPAACLRAAATCQRWRALVAHNMGRWRSDDARRLVHGLVAGGHAECLRFVLGSCGFGTRLTFKGAAFGDWDEFQDVSMAVTNGNAEVLTILLDHGAPASYSALETVAGCGRVDMLELLLERFVGVEVGGFRQNTYLLAFTKATSEGHLHVLRFLWERTNTFNRYGIYHAIGAGHLDCVAYLCEHEKGDPVAGQPRHWIKTALLDEQWACMVYLYERYRPPITESHDRERLIARADIEVIKQLLKLGFEFSERDLETALNHQRRCACVLAVMAAGSARVALSDEESLRWTLAQQSHHHHHHERIFFDGRACASAAGHGHVVCLRLLHDHGASLDARTTFAAAAHGHLDCLRFAHERGVAWKRGAARAAAQGGHVECLEYALSNGCPIPHGRQLGGVFGNGCLILVMEEEARRREVIDKHLVHVQGKVFVVVGEQMKRRSKAAMMAYQVVGRTERFVKVQVVHDVTNNEKETCGDATCIVGEDEEADDKSRATRTSDRRMQLFQLALMENRTDDQYVLYKANKGTRAIMLPQQQQ